MRHGRSGKVMALAQAQALFATEREAVAEAFPGDVIGINNPAVGECMEMCKCNRTNWSGSSGLHTDDAQLVTTHSRRPDRRGSPGPTPPAFALAPPRAGPPAATCRGPSSPRASLASGTRSTLAASRCASAPSLPSRPRSSRASPTPRLPSSSPTAKASPRCDARATHSTQGFCAFAVPPFICFRRPVVHRLALISCSCSRRAL